VITKMTGTLARVLDEEVRLQVGPFEYQVLVPEAVRRHVQMKVGTELTLHISEYFEGNQTGSKLVPRKIGFATEAELEFFELICTVDKIGVKKGLKALSRPVNEIADAISRQDAKWLTTLPGIGAATAEQMIATLKRKVTKFALSGRPAAAVDAGSDVDGKLIEDVYQALMSVGHSPIEARTRLDQLLQSGKAFDSVSAALTLIFTGK
jgi:Holliday junction DNA helicase RuvA